MRVISRAKKRYVIIILGLFIVALIISAKFPDEIHNSFISLRLSREFEVVIISLKRRDAKASAGYENAIAPSENARAHNSHERKINSDESQDGNCLMDVVSPRAISPRKVVNFAG